MLISHDMVRMQILHAKDVEALPLIMQLLKYGRQNSDITILEGILPTEVYMPLFEMAVQEYGKDKRFLLRYIVEMSCQIVRICYYK